MPVNPQPEVLVDNEWIACQGDWIHQQVTALAGLDVTWGRESIFSHPTPAVAHIRLYDPTGAWSDRVRNRSALGKPVNIFYWDDELGRWFIIYRGNIAELDAEEKPIAGDRGHHGWLVTLTCTSRETEMANIAPPGEDVWPPETALNRAISINNYHWPTTGIQDVFFEPTKVNQTMWGPDDPSNNNILQHTETFMQSMGVSYSYWPDENVIRYTARYAISSGSVDMATLPDDGGPREVVLRPSFAFSWYGGDITSWSSHLPGNQSVAEGSVNIRRSDGINRIQLDWRDRHQQPQPWGDWSTIEPANMPTGTPVRLYRATSWLDDGIYLDPTVNNLLERAQAEGSIPPHPEVTWNTKHNGGFHKWSDARHFLTCGEWVHFSYLSCSRYSRWLQHEPPVYGRIGGSIHFDGKHWKIGARLQAVRPNNWGPFAALPWSFWQERVKWEPYPGWSSTDRFFHDSISWGDLGYVSNTTQFQNY